RARATRQGRRGLRRSAVLVDDSWCGEAHGQDTKRLEPRLSGGGDRTGAGADGDQRVPRRNRGGTVDQLLRRTRPARDRSPRLRRIAGDRGEPRPAHAGAPQPRAWPGVRRGTDAHYFLDSKRDWVVTGSIAGSYLTGSQPAVSRL